MLKVIDIQKGDDRTKRIETVFHIMIHSELPNFS